MAQLAHSRDVARRESRENALVAVPAFVAVEQAHLAVQLRLPERLPGGFLPVQGLPLAVAEVLQRHPPLLGFRD